MRNSPVLLPAVMSAVQILLWSTAQATAGIGIDLSQDQSDKMRQMIQDTDARAKAKGLEKCYGVSAPGKNDCSAGAHSCAGQATIARDTQSFLLIPAGTCLKITGGALKSE